MTRVTMVIALVVLCVAPSGTVAAAPLAALPATVRVNVAGLGGSYAKVGAATGSLTVTDPEGKVLYRGDGFAVTRLNVRRLADPEHTLATVPDPVASGIEGRRQQIAARRQSHPRGQGVPRHPGAEHR
jgi:hypothetical protein